MVNAALIPHPVDRSSIDDPERFQRLVELTDNVMVTMQLDGTLTYVSPGLKKLFGYEPADWIGKSFAPLIHPDDAIPAMEFNRNIVETGEANTGFQCRHITQDGDWIWVSINVAPIKDNSGMTVGLQAILHNINDQKQKQEDVERQYQLLDQAYKDLKIAETEVRLREESFRDIHNYVPGALYQYKTHLDTGKSVFTYFSPRVIDLYEVDAATLMADESLAWSMVHPEDLDQLRGKVKNSIHEARSYEYRIITPSGKVKWIQGKSEPIPSLTDVSIHNGIFIDITDQKTAEAEVKAFAARQTIINQVTTQIRNSLDIDAVISTAIHSIQKHLDLDNCCFAWYDPHNEEKSWHVIQQASREGCGIGDTRGIYPSSLVGPVEQFIIDQETIKIEDVEAYPEPIHRSFLKMTNCKSEMLVPLKTDRAKIGVIICVEHRNPRIWDPTEVDLLKTIRDQLAIAIIQADLYQQSRAKSQQLKQTLKTLKETQLQVIQSEKMSSLGHLVAGIAHEINNPVNFIHGNVTHTRNYTQDLLDLVKLYQDAYPTPSGAIVQQIEDIDLAFLQTDLPKTLSSMQMGTERIREIVKSLRNFSRLDEVGSKAVDIHEGIESTLLILQNRLGKEGARNTIAIKKHYGELPLIECFAGKLNQVFMNVLANAMDALEEHGSEHASQITIATEMINNSQASIVIHDNGPGIPTAIQSKIFDPFFTTKPVGKGTGMGMSISYQIVTETHGGTLTVQSTPETGTTFIITIPCQRQLRDD